MNITDLDNKINLLFEDADNDIEQMKKIRESERKKEFEKIDDNQQYEPGCLSFIYRRKKAEQNPFLSDFFKKFNQREAKRGHKFLFFRFKSCE